MLIVTTYVFEYSLLVGLRITLAVLTLALVLMSRRTAVRRRRSLAPPQGRAGHGRGAEGVGGGGEWTRTIVGRGVASNPADVERALLLSQGHARRMEMERTNEALWMHSAQVSVGVHDGTRAKNRIQRRRGGRQRSP